MATLPPPPDVYTLLPPILACLPTAFASSQPPPALLPLLSPILRQKVHLLSASIHNARSHDNTAGNWLPLLTWQSDLKHRLVHIVSELQLEPHPVSGELDLFSDDPSPEAGHIEYRRLDGETLHARVQVTQYGIAVVWLWCVADDGAVGIEALNAAFMPTANVTSTSKKTENGWRVTEVLPLNDEDGTPIPHTGPDWSATIAEAEESFKSIKSVPVTQIIPDSSSGPDEAEADDDDDDDYWASYDRTPGPASLKPSPKPPTPGALDAFAGAGGISELDYYERYGSVQPALDPHDPDEAEGIDDYSCSLGREHKDQQESRGRQDLKREPSYFSGATATGHDNCRPQEREENEEREIHSPSPTRPNSQDGERPVDVLQRKASCTTAVELGVKQHVSHELKSLFRLCQNVGIERSEFERMIELELATLGAIEL